MSGGAEARAVEGWASRRGPRANLSASGPLARTTGADDLVIWAACVVSITMLLVIQWATSLDIGGVSTLVVALFVAPWIVIAASQPRATVSGLSRGWLLLTLPVFALLSTAWSGYQPSTFKSANEYVLTTIVAIVAASCVRPRTLLSALLVASAVVVAVSAGVNVARSTNVGLFGSKNYFGLSVAIMAPAGWAVAIDRFQPRIFRFVGVLAMVSAPALLVQSASTGALICSFAAAAAVCAVLAVSRLEPIARFALTVLLLAIGGILALVWLDVGDFSQLLNAAGKDTTLTGRTLLWSAAMASIASHPVLGVGYQAYWQVGSWGAEQLWQLSYVTNKTGYHFHDTYLEVTVDLGLVGLAIFALNLIAILLRVWRNVVFSRITPEKMFGIYVIVLLLLRSPIEVDLFWQFQTPTIILCMAWIYLGAPPLMPSGDPARRVG